MLGGDAPQRGVPAGGGSPEEHFCCLCSGCLEPTRLSRCLESGSAGDEVYLFTRSVQCKQLRTASPRFSLDAIQLPPPRTTRSGRGGLHRLEAAVSSPASVTLRDLGAAGAGKWMKSWR